MTKPTAPQREPPHLDTWAQLERDVRQHMLRNDMRRLANLHADAERSLMRALSYSGDRQVVSAAADLAGLDHALQIVRHQLEALETVDPPGPPGGPTP